MSRKNTANGFSYHHLTPKSRDGKGRHKIKVPNNEHKAWHTLVKNAKPEEVADILSHWIDQGYRLVAVSKNHPQPAIKKINEWLSGNFTLQVKERSAKIIRFIPHHSHYPVVSAEERLPS